MRRMRCCSALAALLAAIAGGAGAADKVVLVGAKQEKREGKVVRDDAEGVTLEIKTVSGVAQAQYARDQVKEVIYDGTPQEYVMGKESFLAGDYDNALNHLQSAAEKLVKPQHDLLEQYVLYYTGECQRRIPGEQDAAIATFEKLRAMGAKTRFRMEAIQGLINLYLAKGETGQVTKLLGELGEGSRRADRLAILLIKAAVEEKQNRLAQALALYQQAADQAGGTDAEAAAKAEIGSLRCLIGLKKYEEATRRARSLLRAAKSSETYAQGYLLLGDVLKAQAKTPEDWEAALLAYLRVPTLYGGDEATEAKALYEAAMCYRQIPGEKSKQRADRLLAILKEKYPASPYLGAAR